MSLNVQEVKLNRNRIAGSRGSLTEILTPFANVKRLGLSGLCIGEKAAEELPPLIGKFRGMQLLDLRGNQLGKVGNEMRKKLRGTKVLLS